MGSNKRTFIELFVLSAVSLYFELLVIRWMSADIRAFTVFRTFPLVTCFVGLGAGLALSSDEIFAMSLPALLQFVGFMLAALVLHIGFWGFPSASVFQWQNLVFSGSTVANPEWQQMLHYSGDQIFYLVAFMLVLILLLAGPFAVCYCIGARLGALFNQLSPLRAYAANLAGAITGSIIFALLSFAGLAPWMLLIPPVAIIAFFVWQRFGKNLFDFPVAIVVVVLALLAPHQSSVPLYPMITPYVHAHETLWSPYQRIDLTIFNTSPTTQQDKNPGEFFGVEVGANRAFYQAFFNHRLGDGERGKKLDQPLKDVLASNALTRDLPYQMHPEADDVLIVGAGTGEDVEFAVRHGAKSVDAVEIDPVILSLGKKYNPDYASPAVHLVLDDARHYFNHTEKKYDLIIFGHLDSQVVTGQGSSVRLDGYVYTRESIAKALSLLKPHGMICLDFIAVAPWVRDRFMRTIQDAAGYMPISTGLENETIFFIGPSVTEKTVALPAGWPGLTFHADERTRILTDDWPYLYVNTDVFDFPYLLVVLEIIGLSLFAARKVVKGKVDSHALTMVFLGAAFMLLELHAISFLSLTYGSTWLTSAIVINCILIMLFFANLVVMRFNTWLGDNLKIIYGLLFAAIAATYLVPTEGIPFAVLTFLTVLPLGLAGLIFPTVFARSENPARALAFNLFGAVIGGLLEYLSNYTGIKGLVLVGGLLYLLSFICFMRSTSQRETKSEAPASS